ncbi:endolytic transglycosylase MltG [Periweissella ghanensis]|uniref:Endolytic murein transglycosylase n=1 Tax=Periweissella ghanensis TaxID=467997 RepID=A0ABM8Z9Q4_9LACO|nr:endolytic transglycosylase MltG [Periweissella ghanensis]CAH0418203.1 Endolytic murein transglycosylase [Periweissella ghanensis]
MKDNNNFDGPLTRRSGMTSGGHGAKLRWIIITIIGLGVLILLAVGGTYLHERSDFSAKDLKSTKIIEFKVPQGANAGMIGQQLQNAGVIKYASAFKNYVDLNNVNNLNAGYFALSPKMSIATIVAQLQKPGALTPKEGMLQPGFVLMREGENAAQFAQTVAKQTKFSAKAWLATLNDQAYLQKLAKQYPDLLNSAINAPTRYKLEGYLYPATYDVRNAKTPADITTQMVAKTNQVLQPYYADIKKQKLSVQQILTLASLVEREAVTPHDRGVVAGVFLNRIDDKMTLGSDVAVKYALNTTKTNLSIADTKVDSPYNLYKNQGFGPGPFNSPSLTSILAVLHPIDRDKKYLFFIANLKTGKVYFTQTIQEHDALNAKLVAQNNNTK